MDAQKRDFDTAAASWDENPIRTRLAGDVAQAIRKAVVLTSAMDVLDFGCGTGLLGLQFSPHVCTLTGVDSSQGMLAVFQKKAADQKLGNAQGVLLDIETGAELPGRYDVIVSSMTLHHVQATETLLGKLHRALKPSGHLCVADLDLEGGQFHDSNEGVFHFGFDRGMLQAALTKTGFSDVRIATAAQVMKPNASGAERCFTVFLATGKKASE
jgi:2-polyprenyl-3-methyl-5-hydroxy-6-metoxy-1,4-benzoquinol methylase